AAHRGDRLPGESGSCGFAARRDSLAEGDGPGTPRRPAVRDGPRGPGSPGARSDATGTRNTTTRAKIDAPAAKATHATDANPPRRESTTGACRDGVNRSRPSGVCELGGSFVNPGPVRVTRL